MARYGSSGSVAGVNTANSAAFNLMGGTTDRIRVLQVIVNVAVAPTTAPLFYLARTTARGTQASTLAGIPLDLAEAAGVGTLDVVAPATPPTFVTTARIQQGGLGITAGGTLIFTFYDQPLIIPATAAAGMAIVNANASGATLGTFTCSVLWEE